MNMNDNKPDNISGVKVIESAIVPNRWYLGRTINIGGAEAPYDMVDDTIYLYRHEAETVLENLTFGDALDQN